MGAHFTYYKNFILQIIKNYHPGKKGAGGLITTEGSLDRERHLFFFHKVINNSIKRHPKHTKTHIR